MADQNKTEEEPSIEEILASIRQIISDDDEEAPAAAAEEPEPEPEPEESVESFPEEEEDILELTQPVEKEKPAIEVDLMDHEEPAPPPPPPKMKEPDAALPPMEDFGQEAIFTRNVENTAYAAISELASKAAIERMSGVTIEDVVRDELRPMLREWLNKHLPVLIERLVQGELERVSKRVLGDLGE